MVAIYRRLESCILVAEVAQLAERNLAKVEVAGSNPVFRSDGRFRPPSGDVAEWLGAGLQNPLHRFDSGRRLQEKPPGRQGVLLVYDLIDLSSSGGLVRFWSAWEYVRVVDPCTGSHYQWVSDSEGRSSRQVEREQVGR